MIVQTCCNHWECPCCGVKRAAHEYRRIVDGCAKLSEAHKLYFWTLTCRGREMPLETAERDYLVWTNRMLTNARTKAKREGHAWAYVQVTERQKRQHPHSHIITTYLPSDAVRTGDRLDDHNVQFSSAWFARANSSAGLGSQHRISQVASAEGVSRYVAKYLFKASMRETFPPKWKRIRYSANFPQLVVMPPDYAEILLNGQNWRAASRQRVTWVAENEVIYQMARHRGMPVMQKAKDA